MKTNTPTELAKLREATAPATTDELFDDGALLDEALRQAARDALLRHKRAGVPVVVWRDAHVVEVPAEQIQVTGQGPSVAPGGVAAAD